MKELEYLSDEELLALIRATEEGELLHAPGNMKGEVLSQTKPEGKKQFYLYCLRVGLATVASLALLFIPTPKETPDTLSLTQQFYHFTGNLEEQFSDLNQTFAEFDFNFDFDFGGNHDE